MFNEKGLIQVSEPFTWKIRKSYDGYPHIVLASLREKYWSINGHKSNTTGKIVRNCDFCFKQQPAIVKIIIYY